MKQKVKRMGEALKAVGGQTEGLDSTEVSDMLNELDYDDIGKDFILIGGPIHQHESHPQNEHFSSLWAPAFPSTPIPTFYLPKIAFTNQYSVDLVNFLPGQILWLWTTLLLSLFWSCDSECESQMTHHPKPLSPKSSLRLQLKFSGVQNLPKIRDFVGVSLLFLPKNKCCLVTYSCVVLDWRALKFGAGSCGYLKPSFLNFLLIISGIFRNCGLFYRGGGLNIPW